MSFKEIIARLSLGICIALLVITAAAVALAVQAGNPGLAVLGFFVGGLNIVNIHLAQDIIRQAEEGRKKNEPLKKIG